MESFRKFSGTAGVLVALSGAGIGYFLPDYRIYGWVLMAIGLVLALAGTILNSEDLINIFRGRPFRYGANAVFYSLFVLCLVAGGNFLAARHNHRFDLTTEGAHSLSPQTIQILKSLDQDMTVVAFYSSQYVGGRQKAVDLLDEYKYHSPRVTVRVIDPQRNPAEARAYNIEADGTIVVTTKVGEARSTAATEEDLTNAIVKATTKVKKVVCVTTGHGEKGTQESAAEGFQQAAEAIKKENFDLREIRLMEQSGVPADCGSVIVPGPTHALLAPESEALHAYLKSGGRLLVMSEPRTTTGLETLLAGYGLKTGGDFIVDPNPMSRLFGGSAAAPVVYEYGAHQITKDMERVATIFPTVGSVEASTATEPDTLAEGIAHTGASSWGEMGDLADRVSLDPTDKPGPLDIAAVAVQKHAAQAAPADPNAGADQQGAAEKPAGTETRIVLFGDSDFAANNALMVAGNKDLFLNTIAWLNERSDLISIRPKPQAPQPIILTGAQQRLLYGWWFLAPVVAAVVGFGVHIRRRRL